MAIAHKSPTLNHCALEQLSRCLQTTSVLETLFTFRHPYKCAPPNSSSLLLRIIKSLELSKRSYQASEAHYQLSPIRTLARPFHTKPDPTMPPFYPYTPVFTKHHPPLHPHAHFHRRLRPSLANQYPRRTKQHRNLSLHSRHYRYHCRRADLVPWISVVYVSCAGCDAGAEEGSIKGEEKQRRGLGVRGGNIWNVRFLVLG
jgi:hypothetical protein